MESKTADDPQPLAVGDIIQTKYESGPYRVVDIRRGCTCPNYVAQLNSRTKLPPAPAHLHVTCVPPDAPEERKDYYWLNCYLEEKSRIRNVDSPD